MPHVACFECGGGPRAQGLWFSSHEFFRMVSVSDRGRVHSFYAELQRPQPWLRHRLCSGVELEFLKEHGAVPPTTSSATLVDAASMIAILKGLSQDDMAAQLAHAVEENNVSSLRAGNLLRFPLCGGSPRRGAPLSDAAAESSKRLRMYEKEAGATYISVRGIRGIKSTLATSTHGGRMMMHTVADDARSLRTNTGSAVCGSDGDGSLASPSGTGGSSDTTTSRKSSSSSEVKKDVCAFCWLEDDEQLGLGVREGPYIVLNKQRWVHRQCAIYAATVRVDDTGKPIDNVESEIKRGRQLKCFKCKRSGAVSGCSVRKCRRSYHLPCARKDGCKETISYALFCPQHSASTEQDSTAPTSSSSSSDALPALEDLFAVPFPYVQAATREDLERDNARLREENETLRRRFMAVLLRHRRGVDVAEKLQLVKEIRGKSAEDEIADSRARWKKVHGKDFAKPAETLPRGGDAEPPSPCPPAPAVAGTDGKPRSWRNHAPRHLDAAGRDRWWQCAIEFPLVKVDHRFLSHLTPCALGELRTEVHCFLEETKYWQDRVVHMLNPDFVNSDRDPLTYEPAAHTVDAQMLKWCRVVRLTEDYFVPAMAGQCGVVAGDRTIPKFTVLTRYTGQMFSQKDFDLRYIGTNQESLRDNYGANIYLDNGKADGEAELVVDGFEGGLSASFNDYRHTIEVGQDEHNDVRLHNCNLTQVNVCGDPMILVVTKWDVEPGTALLLDYGDPFWARYREDRHREKLVNHHHAQLVQLATGQLPE